MLHCCPCSSSRALIRGVNTHNDEVNLNTHVTVDSLIDLWALVEEWTPTGCVRRSWWASSFVSFMYLLKECASVFRERWCRSLRGQRLTLRGKGIVFRWVLPLEPCGKVARLINLFQFCVISVAPQQTMKLWVKTVGLEVEFSEACSWIKSVPVWICVLHRRVCFQVAYFDTLAFVEL